ncbi:MAG: lysozyme inhibitor LprI family protein [Oricola sp.]
MRLLPALAGLVLLTGAPALAQDDDWDCSKGDNLPQQAMNLCAKEDYERADEALNVLWPMVRDYMRQVDSYQEEKLKGAEAALLKAQRGWIDYRDGQCEATGFYARGGTLEPLLVFSCKAELTRDRTEELLLLMQEN